MPFFIEIIVSTEQEWSCSPTSGRKLRAILKKLSQTRARCRILWSVSDSWNHIMQWLSLSSQVVFFPPLSHVVLKDVARNVKTSIRRNTTEHATRTPLCCDPGSCPQCQVWTASAKPDMSNPDCKDLRRRNTSKLWQALPFGSARSVCDVQKICPSQYWGPSQGVLGQRC